MRLIRRISKIILPVLIITGWVFSGWPQIWNNPSFPPKIQRVEAAAAAPFFVAAGAVTSSTGAITPALPTGIVTGDILLLFLKTSNQAISIATANGGTWTEVTNSPQGVGAGANTTSSRITIFWSRYNGTQTAPVTSDSGNMQLGRMIAVRGAVESGDPTDITAGATDSTANTNGSIPGATTTVDNDLVIAAIATALPDASGTANFSAWANADLGSISELTDKTVTAGVGGGLGVAAGPKASAGSYGATTVTLANSSVKASISIAIKPAVAAIVSISVTDGTVTYGTIPANQTKTTCGNDLNDAQTVTNNGNVNEDFTIKGQNSANWALSAAGSETYEQDFQNGACALASGFSGTALDTTGKSLAAGVAPSGTVTLNLKLYTPTATTHYDQQSVDVTITATQSP